MVLILLQWFFSKFGGFIMRILNIYRNSSSHERVACMHFNLLAGQLVSVPGHTGLCELIG